MKAKEEFIKWRATVLPSIISEERAYITGFNRAVELMELFLKEKQDEAERVSQS